MMRYAVRRVVGALAVALAFGLMARYGLVL
jgi:hypothetical protein